MTEPTDPTEPVPRTERVSRTERVEESDPVAAEQAWWQNAWLIIPIALILMIVLIALFANRPDEARLDTDDETTTTTERDDDQVVVPTEPDDVDTTTTTTTQEATTTEQAAWQEVARLEGSSQKRGDVFTLREGDARLRYESRADTFSVYVIDEGDTLDESAAVPEVTCAEACSDETRLAKSPGEYYLEVDASGGAWVVVVEVLA